MAIDSALERRSAAISQAYQGPGITPDATPDEDWRQSASYNYAGIDYQLADQFVQYAIVTEVARSVVISLRA